MRYWLRQQEDCISNICVRKTNIETKPAYKKTHVPALVIVDMGASAKLLSLKGKFILMHLEITCELNDRRFRVFEYG